MATPLIRDPETTSPLEIIQRGIIETEMKFFLVLVDDEMAADLLQYNLEPKQGQDSTNRKASPVKIQEYTTRILEDEWFINPQPIIFSEVNSKGRIEQLDGQQRLKAIRAAHKVRPGVCVPLVICVEAPLLSKMAVDQGKARVPADWLRMDGEVGATQLSFAVKMLHCYLERPFVSVAAWRSYKMAPVAQKQYLDKHAALRQGLSVANASKTIISPYVGAVIWYLLREEYDVFIATEFMQGLATGADLKLGEARLAAREYLSQKRLDKEKMDGFVQLAILIVAAGAWLRKVEKFRPGAAFRLTDSKFPRLIPKDKLPEELFTRDHLVSLSLDEMQEGK